MSHDSRPRVLSSRRGDEGLCASRLRRPAARALLLAATLAALLVSRVGAEGPSEPDLEESSPRPADLVVDLGHENWSRREAAQEGLLGQRDRAITVLRDALRSENLELAYRAKYLLDMLDPLVGRFQVIRIRLGKTPRVTATGYASGKIREELTLETQDGSDDPASTAGATASFQYSISFSAAQDRGLEILVTRAPRGYSTRDTLSTPLPDESAISLLARTEECHYSEFGLRLERERQRYLTLIRVRYGRASEVEEVELPPDPELTLATILREILAQSGSRVPETRAAAIEILSFLGSDGYLGGGEFSDAAREVFTVAMDEPGLRPLAILGLGRPEDLRELVASAPARSERASEKLPPPRIRAAVRLLERGDATHLPLLVDRLTQDNPEHLHYVMAGIADFVDARARHSAGARAGAEENGVPGAAALDEDSRRLLVRRIFSDSFFAHAVWQNHETAYFVDRIGSLLDPEREEDRAVLEQALARLEGLVSGTSGPARISLAACQPIFRRLAARLPSPPSERAMLFRLLPSMMNEVAISQTLRAVDEALRDEPLSDAELGTLLGTLRVYRNMNAPSAAKLLAQVLGSIRLREGQLRPLVSAALDVLAVFTSATSTSTRSTSARSASTRSASTRPTSALLREVGARLNFLTGVPAPGAPADVEPWRSWLEEESGVHEQEKKVLALQDSPGTGPSLLLMEFDLMVQSSPSGVGRDTGPAAFDLVDGRVLDVREGEPIVYSDRWGNTLRRRLRQVKQALQGRATTPPRPLAATGPLRYRFEDSHLQLTVGVPSLSSMTGRDVRSTWVETSAFFLGSRALPRRSVSNYQTVALLRELTEDRPPPGSSPAALWQWFVRTHLLTLPEDASSTQTGAVARILRALEIEDAGPALLAIFEREPTPELARHLYTVFGERRGIEYFRDQLPNLTGNRRLFAAQLLAEVGVSEGVETLLGDGRHASLIALDRYLQLPSPPPAERGRVLDFLVGRLKFDSVRDEPDAKIIFATLEREAGDDFGFTTAVGTSDAAEKTALIRKAIDGARAWRQRVSPAPPAPAGSPR